MRYYIADRHFYHKNLLTEMDNRGFKSVEQMNEVMIEKWNKKVHARDEVVILGDLSLGNGKETNEILCRLKGRLCLIRGNHDEKYLRDKDFDVSRFEWVKDYVEIHDNKRKIVLMNWCCTIKVDIGNSKGQYEKDKQEVTKDGSESTKIQHRI